MADIENRVSRVEGEMKGMQQVANALFELADRTHADMLDMKTELKADIRAGRWERLGIVVALLTLAASIYFDAIPIP